MQDKKKFMGCIYLCKGLYKVPPLALSNIGFHISEDTFQTLSVVWAEATRPSCSSTSGQHSQFSAACWLSVGDKILSSSSWNENRMAFPMICRAEWSSTSPVHEQFYQLLGSSPVQCYETVCTGLLSKFHPHVLNLCGSTQRNCFTDDVD